MSRLLAIVAIIFATVFAPPLQAFGRQQGVCIDAQTAELTGHTDADGDQVSTHAGKAAPHHHANPDCHSVAYLALPADSGSSVDRRELTFMATIPLLEDSPAELSTPPPIA